MKHLSLASVALACMSLFLIAAAHPAVAQGKVLNAVFAPTPITVDGVAETAWQNAPTQNIAICMNPGLTQQLSSCSTSGTVQAMWNGPLLYLLFTVTDPDISTASSTDTNRSAVQIFADQYDDKFPKFEEDDGQIIISAAGQQTGNGTNAGLKYFPTVWSTHLQSYATSYRTDTSGNKIGYTIEVGWYIGDRPLKNETKLGMEFVIYASSSTAKTNQYRLYWSSGNNHGTDDTSIWGDVVLTGWDGSTAQQLNTYMLQQNIKKATPAADSTAGLVTGIWTTASENAVATALSNANAALTATSQGAIDSANTALDTALRNLRRSGKYADPYDLPSITYLPDPFTFYNGSAVTSLADWQRRKTELKDLMQYYEYGYMPAAPQSLTAVSTAASSGGTAYKSIKVTIADNNASASFTPFLYLPSGTPPAGGWPVIVELDMMASPYFLNKTFLNGGYAVLSIPASDYTSWGLPGVASDDGNHTGTFFTLYPYKLDASGNDRGILMAWAWGASRGVDALQYLAANDSGYAGLLDLNRLVITGFSRWGKASLVAGMMDERFKLTAPGGSGSGGAAPYRYDAFGNTPFRSAPYGNVYPWGRTPGGEVMGDHVRHQTHNSNEMIRRFLNDTTPAAVQQRMYQTSTYGYGNRMPFDHHEQIAVIAPRAVLIDNTNDDYADNAEGDSIGYEGAMPVYKFLGAPQNLALDLYMGGGGHSLKASQSQNIVNYANFVLYGTAMASDVQQQLTTDPYLNASTYDTYYGGLSSMMPWLATMPHANLLTGLTVSTGTLSPAFATATGNYTVTLAYGATAIKVTPTTEDPNATITVNGFVVASGVASQTIALAAGPNPITIVVTSVDGYQRTYTVVVNVAGATTATTLASSTTNANLNASVRFTATVTATQGSVPPTGTVTFMEGTTTLGTGTLSASTATASTATLNISTLTAGTHAITAVFAGNNAFITSTSAALSQLVTAPAISGAFSPSSLNILPGASGTTTLTLTPVGGYTATVALSCGTLPAQMSCSFSPSTEVFTGSNIPQTSTLTISTKGTAAMNAPARPGSKTSAPLLAGLILFPGFGLLALARWRRSSSARRIMMGVLLAVASLGAFTALSGCGASNSNTSTVGTYVVPVNITAGSTVITANVVVVVQ